MSETSQQIHRFIPFRVADIVTMCLQKQHLEIDEKSFRHFTQLLSNVFHYEFKMQQDAMKDIYASIDPDADTRQIFPIENDIATQFVEELKQVLNQANYEAISKEELNQAMSKSSLFNLRLKVDFDDFSNVLLFCRGQSLRRETIKKWFGFSETEVEFINYDRVVVYIRYKDSYAADKADWLQAKPGSSMLKLFQNVPKADLEMLFPNTQLGMRLLDKLMIGVPAVISGGIVLSTKVGATLLLLSSMLGFWFGLRQEPVEMNATNLTILFAGLGALGAYVWKQFSKYKNRKLRFMQQLTENLYFKNLDNNAGVIFRLLNDAEEEECKEAILAYYFLLLNQAPISAAQLDQNIQQWLSENWQYELDFEIEDALRKLQRLDLVTANQGCFQAEPLSIAIEKLNQRWDAFF